LFEQFKALEFELKMDLQIKKKKRKKKEKTSLGPTLFRHGLSPSTRAPSSFSPGPRPSSEPNVAHALSLSRVGLSCLK